MQGPLQFVVLRGIIRPFGSLDIQQGGLGFLQQLRRLLGKSLQQRFLQFIIIHDVLCLSAYANFHSTFFSSTLL